MSNGRDDFRDDTVARAWREHVRDEPPPAIDDAIRAAARRAVDAKPQVARKVAEAREPWRWWMPLAAAATIGAVAIGVLQNMPQDAGEATVVSDMTDARPAAPAAPAAPATHAAPAPMREAVPQKQVAPPATAPETRDRTPLPMPRLQASKPDAAQKRADAPSEAKETFVPSPPADARQVEAASDKLKQEQVGALAKRAQPIDDLARRNERDAGSSFAASPPPASAPATAPAKDAADADAPESRAKVRAAEAPAVASHAAAGRSAREPQAMAVTPPDTFVATIRRLLAAGDRDGAVRELQRFRRTHADADARLPDDLKAFAASVPR